MSSDVQFSTYLTEFCNHAGLNDSKKFRDAAVGILRNMRNGVSERIVVQMLDPAEVLFYFVLNSQKALHEGIDTGNIMKVIHMLDFFDICCIELGSTFHMEFIRLRCDLEQCIFCKNEVVSVKGVHIQDVYKTATQFLMHVYQYCHHDSINPGYLSYLVPRSNFGIYNG